MTVASPAVADRLATARTVFDGLWERHHAAVYGYCCHLTDEHRGADLTQDVFLDAYRVLRAGRFDGRNERTWLLTNATRKALDRRRLGWGRFARGALERLFPEHFRPRVDDGARAGPPERSCAVEAERAAVAAAVRRLRPSHCAVLWLREWQAMDYNQISRVLGISRASTKAMLWRARTRLREEWLRQEAPA